MDCELIETRQPDGKSRYTCRHCDQVHEFVSGLSVRRECKNTACGHRGDEIDRVECPTCQGKAWLKVFACAVHERCVLEGDVGLKTCLGCGDRKSPEKR